jgi:flagellar motor switch protein FliG
MAKIKLNGKDVKGPQKAAIFLLMMGEKYTSEVFKKLEPDEITMLVSYMSEIKSVPQHVLTQIMEEFLGNIENEDQLMVEGASFLENVAGGALGKERAKAVYKELGKTRKNLPFSYLDSIDNNIVVNLIKGEHPQTIALILASLKSGRAAKILSELPEKMQADVAMRIVQMDHVPKEVIQEVDQMLQKDVRGLGDSGSTEVGGSMVLANILNEIDMGSEEQILSSIEEQDEQMAEEVRRLMFVFENLLKVDDRGFREILKYVDRQELTVALRTASEELKQKIFNNLSERAVTMLREDMEIMGPVRISQVEQAQQKILMVARQLESEGKLILGKVSEDTLV